MNPQPTSEQIEEIIQTLQGTCMTFNDGVTAVMGDDFDPDSLDEDTLNSIDLEIFNCATCGWWYETCERSEDEDETICQDCSETDEEE